MSRPIAGEEALPAWLRRRSVQWLVRLGVLLFAVVFAGGWAVGAAFAPYVLWHHHGDPAAVVFLVAWLLIWASIPVFLIEPMTRGRRGQPDRVGYPLWSKYFCYGCFAVLWCAGLAAVLRQGDVRGFVLGAAFTSVVLLLVIAGLLYRETVTIDPLTLKIHAQTGPFHRTRLYQVRLIRDPRPVREEHPDGGFTCYWQVAFDYGSKTVRFGQNMSRQEAEERARELATHV